MCVCVCVFVCVCVCVYGHACVHLCLLGSIVVGGLDESRVCNVCPVLLQQKIRIILIITTPL